MLFSQYRDGAPVTRTKLSEHLSKIAPELKRAKVSSYIVAEAQVKFNEIRHRDEGGTVAKGAEEDRGGED